MRREDSLPLMLIVRTGLKFLVVLGATGGILLSLVSGSSVWGPLGSPEYAQYEHISRRIALPWLITLAALLGLVSLHIKRGVLSDYLAIDMAVITGTALIICGNVAEFHIFTTFAYGEVERGLAWACFLTGHLILLVGALAYCVHDTEEAKEQIDQPL